MFNSGHMLKNMNIPIVLSFAYELTMIGHLEIALVLKVSRTMVIHMHLSGDEDLVELNNGCDI